MHQTETVPPAPSVCGVPIWVEVPLKSSKNVTVPVGAIASGMPATV